ncbi:MAG: single-stranded-DNA-specific exonuclease RecJ [Chromatium okenii]|nr:single-stranded-DNA-specific exonuclease RecJ [Chromatium okenii]
MSMHIRRLPHHAAIAAATTPAALLNAVYANRGVTADTEVTPGLAALEPAQQLRGLDAAVSLLEQQVRAGGHILIIGDYDADGATGSALAVRGLRALGAAQVSYLVPSRFAFGYGLTPAVVDVAAKQQPALIVTVDNGISSAAAVTRAHELGIPVLITDHHLTGRQLPDAAAIVNPNQPGCDFPSKFLSGVGVMFYLLAALRSRLRETGWFTAKRPEPNLTDFLDLVALGTVADVVPLDRNNRILVEQGLRRIRAGRACPGVLALFQIAGRDIKRANAADLGFFIAPRLNAAGRLEEMSLGVECLLTDDPARAQIFAQDLDQLNRRRHTIESEMKQQAELHLDSLNLNDAALPPAFCLYGDDWHQGVLGIIAARIRERYHRPVIAFADSGDGKIRGSGRSIDAVHLRDAVAQVAHNAPGLIEHFGGHAMAVGLTLRIEDFPRFQTLFHSAVAAQLGTTTPEPEILSDGALPPQLLTLETAELLHLAQPWGRNFPTPCFDDCFNMEQARIVGEHHLKLRVTTAAGQSIDAIGFNLAEDLPLAQGQVQLAYQLGVNDYRGVRSVQLLVQTIQSI